MKGGIGLRDLFEWALYDIGLTSQEVGQFFYEVGEKIENVAYHGGEILKSAAETYLTSLLGGPLRAPFLIIDNPSLYGIYDMDYLYIGPS